MVNNDNINDIKCLIISSSIQTTCLITLWGLANFFKQYNNNNNINNDDYDDDNNNYEIVNNIGRIDIKVTRFFFGMAIVGSIINLYKV